MAQKKKYYAVAVGRSTGVFTRWFGEGGAEPLVRGYSGAVYKGFASLEEARAFLKANEGKKRKPPSAAKSKRSAPAKQRTLGTQIASAKKGRILIYTDGGALNNPGPGGYGVVIVNGKHTRELSKGFRRTTNNRMELLACIVGLSAIKHPGPIVLHSDSRYVVNGITKGWARKWRANGWVKSNKEPALNADLWEQLLQLCDKHEVAFRWVKGHAGIAGNERCDELATQAASGRNLAVDTGYESSA
ncbi:MAG: ribonuclease HI [Desulfobacteraceae bacterium]|jgi:ribonuclease HI